MVPSRFSTPEENLLTVAYDINGNILNHVVPACHTVSAEYYQGFLEHHLHLAFVFHFCIPLLVLHNNASFQVARRPFGMLAVGNLKHPSPLSRHDSMLRELIPKMMESPQKQVDFKCGGHNACMRTVSCIYKQNSSNGPGSHHLPQTWGQGMLGGYTQGTLCSFKLKYNVSWFTKRRPYFSFILHFINSMTPDRQSKHYNMGVGHVSGGRLSLEQNPHTVCSLL
jgi:hypothetical protein